MACELSRAGSEREREERKLPLERLLSCASLLYCMDCGFSMNALNAARKFAAVSPSTARSSDTSVTVR